MPLKGFICEKPLEFLSPEKIERINEGSLELLAEAGMTIAHQGCRKILASGGCEVDHETERVRFPRDVVTAAIAQCPSSFPLRSRNTDLTLELGGQ